MARKMICLVSLFLILHVVRATSVEYYRSAFCDAQSSTFFIEKFTAAGSLADDKACHQTPARTMAVKMVGDLDPACVGKLDI